MKRGELYRVADPSTRDPKKFSSSVHCVELISLPKSALTNFIGTLPPKKIWSVNQALRIALEIPD